MNLHNGLVICVTHTHTHTHFASSVEHVTFQNSSSSALQHTNTASEGCFR